MQWDIDKACRFPLSLTCREIPYYTPMYPEDRQLLSSLFPVSVGRTNVCPAIIISGLSIAFAFTTSQIPTSCAFAIFSSVSPGCMIIVIVRGIGFVVEDGEGEGAANKPGTIGMLTVAGPGMFGRPDGKGRPGAMVSFSVQVLLEKMYGDIAVTHDTCKRKGRRRGRSVDVIGVWWTGCCGV